MDFPIFCNITGNTGWVLVAERKECSGSEVEKPRVPLVADCAANCHGIASMFIFGTNDFEKPRCNEEGCWCICETSAAIHGTCDQTDHNGYRLYKYVEQGNLFCKRRNL